MPTTRPRHLVTETDDVAHALDDAAKRWPEDRESRGKLLLHLVEEGHHALLEETARRRAARAKAIQRTGGVLTGVYEPGYLAQLREDWPA